jgi:hypothetical protein
MPDPTRFEEHAHRIALAKARSLGYSQGFARGQVLILRASILDLLEERFGFSSAGLARHLKLESDLEVLRTWLRCAATVSAPEVFLVVLGICLD